MQKSISIADGTGAELLEQLNGAFETLATNFTGGTEPQLTYAGMDWMDTSGTNTVWKRRSADNTSWITMGTYDEDGFHPSNTVSSDDSTVTKKGNVFNGANQLVLLNSEGKLTKTILYNLNPCANEVIATMLGNFQDGTIPGKIQFGSGWWFLDQKDGMEKQMNALSVLGLLSRFVGMLTDSRSFLSYPRHEYFRRTLCNLVGRDIENGEIPASEMGRVNQMIEDISYYNAKNFFQF